MGHYIDSTSAVHIGLLARKPGQAWEEIRPLANWRTGQDGVLFMPPQPEIFDLPALTQLEVAAGVTGAATDIYYRGKIGVR